MADLRITPQEKYLLGTMEMMNESLNGWKWVARFAGIVNVIQFLILVAVMR